MLVFAIAEMFACQAVVLDVVDQLKLPDSGKSLPQKERKTHPAADNERQKQHRRLERPVAEEGIGGIAPRQILAGEHFFFGFERRA